MGLLILGLILFVLLVVVHEYGHFLVAKRNGVEVDEFGVGFPPKLYGRKMGKGIFEGYYTINLLPLGGFVKLKGEHDADTEKGSYGSVRTAAKMRILLAGVGMNLAAALVLFTIVAWVGMPQLVDNQFTVKNDTTVIRSNVIAGYVSSDSPAAKAGIKSGDIISSINGETIATTEQLRQATRSHAGQTVTIDYVRKGDAASAQVQLLNTEEVTASLSTDNPKGYLGVSSTEYKLARSTWSAPIVAIGLTAQFTKLTLVGLANAVSHISQAGFKAVTGHGQQAKEQASEASENVSGPVGIFAILQQGSALGYQFILFVVALISLTLAIMNLLPIPALDGGRAFVTGLFRLMKKPLRPKTEELIHGTGFAALMLLFVVITVVDVRRFF